MNQWFERLTEQVTLAQDEAALKSVLGKLSREAGFFAYAYYHFQAACQTTLSNCAPEWQSRYVERSYALIDPVVRRARKQPEAFAWSNDAASEMNRERRAFFAEAAAFGIRSGITIPITTGYSRSALLTLTSDDADFARRQILNPALAASAAAQLHAWLGFLRVRPTSQTPVRLKADELTYLRWSAEGKSMKAIATIENDSYANVAFHLRNAKIALGATSLPQATAMATKFGLI